MPHSHEWGDQQQRSILPAAAAVNSTGALKETLKQVSANSSEAYSAQHDLQLTLAHFEVNKMFQLFSPSFDSWFQGDAYFNAREICIGSR